jgi:hypothetical protein
MIDVLAISGKCKGRVYEMLTMDLIILSETVPTWKDLNCKASGRIHIFWREGV